MKFECTFEGTVDELLTFLGNFRSTNGLTVRATLTHGPIAYASLETLARHVVDNRIRTTRWDDLGDGTKVDLVYAIREAAFHCANGQRIAGIKAIRTAFGCDLKLAKDITDDCIVPYAATHVSKKQPQPANPFEVPEES